MMNMENLDLDGLHGLIVMLQRSEKPLAQIHLSNLGCHKYNFSQFYKKESDGWWKIQTSSFNSVLNHWMPLPMEVLREDPTWKMFGQIAMLLDNVE